MWVWQRVGTGLRLPEKLGGVKGQGVWEGQAGGGASEMVGMFCQTKVFLQEATWQNPGVLLSVTPRG